MVDDVWNFHLSIKPKGESKTFTFPIPRPAPGIKITDEKLRAKGYEVFIDSSSDSNLATWTSKEPFQDKVSYSARIDLSPVVIKSISKDYTVSYPKGLRKYLKVPELSSEDLDALESLEKAILEGNEDKTSVVRKIYYYVEEEIRRNFARRTIYESLTSGKGSPLTKAKIFNITARRKNVPSRIVVIVKMPEIRPGADNSKLRFTYSNEVFLSNRWIPVDTNSGLFGERPDSHLVIHRNFDEVEKLISKNMRLTIFRQKELSSTAIIVPSLVKKF